MTKNQLGKLHKDFMVVDRKSIDALVDLLKDSLNTREKSMRIINKLKKRLKK